jgi:hypothetical protein
MRGRKLTEFDAGSSEPRTPLSRSCHRLEPITRHFKPELTPIDQLIEVLCELIVESPVTLGVPNSACLSASRE